MFLQAMHEVGSMGVAYIEPIIMKMMKSIQNFALKSSINLEHLKGIAPVDSSKSISDKKIREQLLQTLIILLHPYID